MSYTTVSGLGIVGLATPSAAALCTADGGVKSYDQTGDYTFTVTCANGKSCKGGAEMQPTCTTPQLVCPKADGTDGPPGVPSSWGNPAYNVKNCSPDAQVNTQIRDICNTSLDPLYCYTANTQYKPLLGRLPTPDAVAAWRRWMDAKRRGISYCDSTVQVFVGGSDPRCPATVATTGSSRPRTGGLVSSRDTGGGLGPSAGPSGSPTGATSNTMLYAGLAVAAAVVVGGVFWMKSKKGAAS